MQFAVNYCKGLPTRNVNYLWHVYLHFLTLDLVLPIFLWASRHTADRSSFSPRLDAASPLPDKNTRCSVNSGRDSFAGESLKNSESVALDSTPKKILVRSLYVRQSCFIHTGTKPLSDEMWHGAHLRKTAWTCSKGRAGRRAIVATTNLSGIDQ